MHADYLIVAIDTDRRVKIHKGKDRPVNDQDTRKKILENIKAVDEVMLFDSNEELISIISDCDLRIIGSDWKHKKSAIVGREACKILFYDRVTDESTTKTIEDYINRRQL
jgi:bifunctional ADP-heptose synthase (sugar kinase/adenylyltransferase)